MDQQQKQTLFDPAKVIAIGIASPAAAFLTSRFGIAGTLIGLALSAMILTAVADFLKVYLARTSQTAAHAAHIAAHTTTVTRKVSRNKRPRSKTPYRGFSRTSAPPLTRRWHLLVGRSIVTAGVSFVLALGLVTALEQNAGKSLTCWVWEECPTQPSTEDSSSDTGGGTPGQSTQPSILGGGPTTSAGSKDAGSPPATAGSDASQQQPAPNLGASDRPRESQSSSEAADSGGSGSSEADGSGTQNQQSPSSSSNEDYERQEASHYYDYSEEDQAPTSNSSSSSSSSSDDSDSSPSSSGTTEEGQQQEGVEDQNGAPPDTRRKTPEEYAFPSVPWST